MTSGKSSEIFKFHSFSSTLSRFSSDWTISVSRVVVLIPISYWINSDLFDHGILHSSVKWSPASVSSLLDELKVLCPNRTLTQSKWLDVVSSRMSLSEAQSYWSTFLGLRASLLGQFGDWIDLPTLGILLLCQCYPNVKARADSFHRNETLAQTLATTIAVSQSPTTTPTGIGKPTSARNPVSLNLSKLVRDNASITQFVLDNLLLFTGIAALNLTPDNDFDLRAEMIDKLGILIFVESSTSLGETILGGSDSISSSRLGRILSSNLAWNERLFPSFDLSGPPQQAVLTGHDKQHRCLLVSNQIRATILHSGKASVELSVQIINCSESTIYISDAVKFVSIAGCTDCEIVLVAVTGGVTVNYCDKVTVRVVTAGLRFENSIDCSGFVYSSRAIILTGDTRGITLGPFNVIYSEHEAGLKGKPGLYSDESHAITWTQPICSTLSDSPYTLLAPDKIRLVCFPEFTPPADCYKLAVCWPEVYTIAFSNKLTQLHHLKAEIQAIEEAAAVNKVNAVISGHFREWVSSNNKTKTMLDLFRQRNIQ